MGRSSRGDAGVSRPVNILDGFAYYCNEQGASFETYHKGLELLMDRDGYWLSRGYAAVLAALDTAPTTDTQGYVVRV